MSLLEGGVEDGGLQLNLLVLLGTLGEASEETAQIALDAGGSDEGLAAFVFPLAVAAGLELQC